VLGVEKESVVMSVRHPTPFAELNDVLDRLVDSVQDALGDTFVGAYLQGSLRPSSTGAARSSTTTPSHSLIDSIRVTSS
jgi:hypothetical protein